MPSPALRSWVRATRRWVGAATILLGQSSVDAAEPVTLEPIRVEARAAATCTDGRQFYARMAARTTRVRVAAPDEASRVFVVQIGRRSDAVTGRLTIRDRDGSETHRDIRGRDCAEVVNGLSLVAALAVDPAAKSDAPARTDPAPTTSPAPTNAQPPPPPVRGAPSTPNSSAAPAPPASPAPAVSPAPPVSPAPAVSPVPAAAATTGPADASAPRWVGGVAARGLTLLGVAPDALLGGAAAVEIWRDSPAGNWAARAGLSVAHAEQATFAVGGASARFTHSAAAVDVCPLGVALGAAVTLHACGHFSLGLLTASGSPPASASHRTVRRGWADVGAGSRVDWSVSDRWGLTLQGGCMFPLRRDSYGFGPDAFHEVPWITGTLAAGMYLRLL